MGAAKNKPNAMCFCSDTSWCKWAWSAGASSALPAMTAPSAARRIQPPGSAMISPGSFRGRHAYATAPMTATANGAPAHNRLTCSTADTGVVP
jgi:hypothetical protein